MKDSFKKWFKAAIIRSLRTFAQTMCSFITVGLAISEIDWKYIISVSLVSAIYSILMAISGLPEVEE